MKIFLCALALTVSSTAFAKSKDREPASKLTRCSEVLEKKKIKVCTDLGPLKHCRGDESRIVKRGESYMDEMQHSASDDMWTSYPDHCLHLTSVAEKKSCCGG